MPTVTHQRFRAAMRRMPTSVAIIAGTADGQPIGMLVGSFTSVSLSPLLVGFFGDRSSSTLPRILELDRWTVSLLAEGDTATPEAFRAPVHERFTRVPWSPSPYGTPVLDSAVLVVHCRRHSVLPAGDHELVLGEVLDVAELDLVRRPLVFVEGRMTRLDPQQLLDHRAWQLGWEE